MNPISRFCVILLVALAPGAAGQGTVKFNNFVVNKPMFDSDGSTLLDGGFIAGLYLAGNVTPLATALFRTGALPSGYFNGGDVTVPGTAPGSTATFQIKFWRVSDGGSFEAAAAIPEGRIGATVLFTVLLGSGFGGAPPPGGFSINGGGGLMSNMNSSSILTPLVLTHGIPFSLNDPDVNVPGLYQPTQFCSAGLGVTKWYRLGWVPDPPEDFSVYIHTLGTPFDTVATVTRGSPAALEQSIVVECNDNGDNRVDLSKTFSSLRFTRINTNSYFLAVSAKQSQAATGNISMAALSAPTVDAVDVEYSAFEDSDLNVASGSGLIPPAYRSTAGVASSTQPAHGNVTVYADGSFLYRPTANYYGSDQFSFRLTDGSFVSREGIARITIANAAERATVLNAKLSNGSVQFEVSSGKGDTCEVQMTSDLSQGLWQSVTNFLMGDQAIVITHTLGAGSGYYRVVSR
jgi:hypothetical protein